MPPKKKSKAPAPKKRAQAVTVRIVETRPDIKPAEPPAPEIMLAKPTAPEAKKKVRPLASLRPTETVVRPKTYAWIGVGVSFAFIVVAWVFFMKYFPSSKGPNQADQTLSNIGKIVGQATADLKGQADKLKNSLPDEPTQQDLEIQELDQTVFPEFYQ
ncbi:MAG: hypothetical protein WC497_03300 [Patescibacteria group bacterium]